MGPSEGSPDRQPNPFTLITSTANFLFFPTEYYQLLNSANFPKHILYTQCNSLTTECKHMLIIRCVFISVFIVTVFAMLIIKTVFFYNKTTTTAVAVSLQFIYLFCFFCFQWKMVSGGILQTIAI